MFFYSSYYALIFHWLKLRDLKYPFPVVQMQEPEFTPKVECFI
jgi:hypothetical protein